VQELLREHQRLRIEKLAAKLNLSPSRLEHLFKNDTGVSITKYRSQVRLGEATLRLKSGRGQIKEIAFALGYRHPSSFSRAFRLAFGISPRQCREA
jgi:AraC family transcriptional regulator of arabinose operon